MNSVHELSTFGTDPPFFGEPHLGWSLSWYPKTANERDTFGARSFLRHGRSQFGGFEPKLDFGSSTLGSLK